MDGEFRDYLDKSNFQISALIIRSLVYDESNFSLAIDNVRLRDELYFYKHLVKTQKPSIISALYPIIYSNKSIYIAYEEATKLFITIRKKITAIEQYGIYLLSLMIKNKAVKKEDIIEYTIENLDKQESVKLQKVKIDSIMKYDNILELVFECLNEDKEYMKIFTNEDVDVVDSNSDDHYKEILEQYFSKITQGGAQYKKYESYNIEIIEKIFDMQEGSMINCSLFPQCLISKIINLDNEIIVTLKTKNTVYQICKKL